MRTGAGKRLLVDADQGLDVLPACDLRHDAAEAGVEVDRCCHNIRDDLSLVVDDGHGGLIAGRLDRKDQRRCGLDGCCHIFRPRRDLDRPRADRCSRHGRLPHAFGVCCKRERHLQDQRCRIRPIVARTPACLLEAKLRIAGTSCLICLVNLERCGLGAEHLAVVDDTRHQTRRDAFMATILRYRHILDLEVGTGKDASSVADDLLLVMGHPPAPARLRDLLEEGMLAPGRVGRSAKDLCLECRHSAAVVYCHRTQLRMDGAEHIVDARDIHRCRLLEAEPLALVLLCIGKPRIERKHEGRIAVAAGGTFRRCCRDEPLPRREPECLIDEAGKSCLLEEALVLDEAVSCELKLVLAGNPCPGICCRIGLEDGLAHERALHACLGELIDARVDLVAHRIVHDAEHATDSCVPGSPGCRIERRGTPEGASKPRSDALGRGDADADAREGARTASDDHGVDIFHRSARLGQDIEQGLCQLDIGLAAAHMVTGCKKLGLRRLPRLLLPGSRCCGEHVRRCIERQHKAPFCLLVPHEEALFCLVLFCAGTGILKLAHELLCTRAMRRECNAPWGLHAFCHLVVEALYHHIEPLVAEFALELLAPFDKAGTIAPEHIEEARILELVCIIEAVEVEVVERKLFPLVDHLDREGRARNIVLNPHAPGYAFRELGLAGAEVSREHEHVSCPEQMSEHLAQPLGLLGRGALIGLLIYRLRQHR